jgi:hypothetical protein
MRIRYEAALVMIERARSRGELRSGVTPCLVLELALAPICARTLVLKQPIDDDYIDASLDLLLRGVVA